MLSISLLGPVRILLDGKAVQFDANTVRALLLYLVMHQGESLYRESLAELFWPDQTLVISLGNLRQALLRLKRSLGENGDEGQYLYITRQTVGFNTGVNVDIDVLSFQHLITRTEQHSHRSLSSCPVCINLMNRAVDFYRGDFMSGFGINSLPFEEWQTIQREYLHRQVMQAYYVLVEYYEQRGEYALAADYAHRQVQLEPWSEEAHYQLMRNLIYQGKRSAALAQYKACSEVLKREFNALPSPEITNLYEILRKGKEKEIESLRLKSLTASNLPLSKASFIGREKEQALLLEWLSDPAYRLITIIGPGGVGKTRLALAVSQNMLGSFQDGIWFIHLAGIETFPPGNSADICIGVEDLLVSALVRALNLVFTDESDLRKRLISYLSSKEMLLILDNLEHLQEGGVGFIVELLHRCRQLTLLVTSHWRLNLHQEHALVLKGLPVPGLEQKDGVETGIPGTPDKEESALFDYAGVQLFANRARQVFPNFVLDRENLPAVIEICQFVDGLPLGIELAAALARNASPMEIVNAIQQDKDYLAANWGDSPERHRSLRAIFDYAWNLLPRSLQEIFASLSVFRGGFTYQAAESVLGATTEQLTMLLDHSLLRISTPGRIEMHRVLEMFAEERFARINVEKLNGGLPKIQERHSTYYLDFLAECRKSLFGWQPKEAISAIQDEMSNIQAAWDWASSEGRWNELINGNDPLHRFFELSGNLAQGINLYDKAVANLKLVLERLAEVSSQKWIKKTIGRLLFSQSVLLSANSNYQAAQLSCKQALASAQESDDVDAQIDIILLQAHLYQIQGETEQVMPLIGLVLAVEAISPRQFARACHILGSCHLAQRRLEEASNNFLQAKIIYHELKDGMAENKIVNEMAAERFYGGRLWDALQYEQEFLSLALSLGDRIGEADALNDIGFCYLQLGDIDQSYPYLVRALDLSREMGDQRQEGWALLQLGLLWERRGESYVALNFIQQSRKVFALIRNRQDEMEALTLAGKIYISQRNWAAAESAYLKTLEFFREKKYLSAILISLAGLAQINAEIGRMAQAREYVEEILPSLNLEGTVDVFYEFDIYWVCWRVLKSLDDVRSQQILEKAHQRLYEQAERILDQELQLSYLCGVPAHREILVAWEQAQAK